MRRCGKGQTVLQRLHIISLLFELHTAVRTERRIHVLAKVLATTRTPPIPEREQHVSDDEGYGTNLQRR